MNKIILHILVASIVAPCCNRQLEGWPGDRFIVAMMESSRELTSEDIYDGLTSLRYGASPLVEWQIEGSDTLLLVATLQSSDWVYSNVECGESFVTDSSPDNVIWVAIPSELKLKLQSEVPITDSLSLNNRMLEIIGLRPDGTESTVNLLWVNKNSLLRPSYNPDISTTYGSIEYPAESVLPTWYKGWFESNIEYCYEAPFEGLNYPFTRLGYTYDWGGQTRYGLSEFITVPSSEVIVEAHIGCWSYYLSEVLGY